MYNVQIEWITPSPRGLGDDRNAEIEQLVSGSPRSSLGQPNCPSWHSRTTHY
jgi:hypothetical protein